MPNPINPIHISGTPENDSVQAFDMRLYFDRDEPREDIIPNVMAALQEAPALSTLVSAYELVSDGFGHLLA